MSNELKQLLEKAKPQQMSATIQGFVFEYSLPSLEVSSISIEKTGEVLETFLRNGNSFSKKGDHYTHENGDILHIPMPENVWEDIQNAIAQQ